VDVGQLDQLHEAGAFRCVATFLTYRIDVTMTSY
jgi:hypothetical protein